MLCSRHLSPGTVAMAARKVGRRLNPSRDKQDDEDDQDDAEDADAAMTIAVTVPAEAATEPAEQRNDQDDDKDKSKRRHGAVLPRFQAPANASSDFGASVARTLNFGRLMFGYAEASRRNSTYDHD